MNAATGKWDDVARVRKMMKSRGLNKIHGCSWIDIKNKMHGFLVGDMSHPQTGNTCNAGELDCAAEGSRICA